MKQVARLKILLLGNSSPVSAACRDRWTDFETVSADFTDPGPDGFAALRAQLAQIQPDAVVLCAEMSDFDACEDNCELAFRLNAECAGTVGRACAAAGIRGVMISSYMVFPGDATEPYTEDDRPGPQSVYGQSKLAGEALFRAYAPDRTVVCRTGWLYNASEVDFSHSGAMGSAENGFAEPDWFGNPTGAADVADALQAILLRPELSGVIHIASGGACSRLEFIRELLRLRGERQTVAPRPLAQWDRPAPRPANSRLTSRVMSEYGLPAMPDWQIALQRCILPSKSES